MRKDGTGLTKPIRKQTIKSMIWSTSQVDLAMSVSASTRINAVILETIKASKLGLGMQIQKVPTQRKLIS